MASPHSVEACLHRVLASMGADPSSVDLNGVPRVEATWPEDTRFVQRISECRSPVLLQSTVVKRWPAATRWSSSEPQYIVDRLPTLEEAYVADESLDTPERRARALQTG